ncbi:hypothetical protein ACJMK2_020176 [Sinanodonta woodiana]|uniref:SH3 domain-containing protein n=1 Tax=Sinanodonta woodiana TaxID=1069815 RepID=A0ABD3TZ80_SINWO
MPGVTPREMNGYKDYSPGYGASYMYDPYSRGREDVRRDVREDPYSARIPRNGFGEDIIDESSVDGGPDRDGQSFEVDHLATFTFKSGPINPEDGLTKLKQMENTTGIWTMRCQMIIERRHVVIVDKNTGDEVERFPVHNILEPTAIIRNDRREVYNNLILFTVCDDPGRKNVSSDMHIFQSVRTPAQQVVEMMLRIKGQSAPGGRTLVPPPPSKPAPMPPVQNRFGDASHWINGAYFNNTHGKRSSSVPPLFRGDHSIRSSRTIDYPGSYNFGDDGMNWSQTWRTEWRNSKENQPMQTAYSYNTWTGQGRNEMNTDTVRSKKNTKAVHMVKDRKPKSRWFKFSSKKHVKDPTGFVNNGFRDIETRDRSAPDAEINHYSWSNRHHLRGGGDVTHFREEDLVPYAGHATSMRPGPFVSREELDSGQNEALERDVQLLNNCFDDIEKFVARLQQAAEAFKELERRKKDHSKKKQSGQGMLHMRARAPPSIDFIDIFQKFKFAFNLLAKLKAHIHDPNAPELVHFLFTPLSLIYEASRDPSHGGEELSDKAIVPLLTNDAKQLLLNCLTSKELELWQRLGRSWTDTREEARGYIPVYSPKFYNGWQPFPQGVDSGPAYRPEQVEQPTPRPLEDTIRPLPINTYEDRYAGRQNRYDRDRFDREYPDREIESERNFPIRSSRKEEFRPLTPPPGPSRPHIHEIRPPSPPLQTRDYDVGRREQMFDRQPSVDKMTRKPMSRQDENLAYLRELQRMDATIYEAVHDRTGRNNKELTIEKGDILQVLDSNRNWWKLKNYKGEVGYAPYTILKAIETNDNERRY